MNPKTEERVKEIMPLLPTQAPDGMVEKAEMNGLIRGEALVFTMVWRPGDNGKKKRAVKLMCSACGGNSICEYSKFDTEDTGRTCGYSYGWRGTYGFKLYDGSDTVYKHNSTCVCPLCGYGGTVYLASKINYGTRIDSTNMLSLHNFDGVLGLLGWYIAKYIGKDGKTSTVVSGTDGVLVLGKTLVRVRKYTYFFSTQQLLHSWEYRKTFDYDINTVPQGSYFNLDRNLIEQTTGDRSGLFDYVSNGGRYPIKFLRTWQKYPHLENLAVQGYSKLLDSIFDSYYYSVFDIRKHFNMKAKSPDKMLGINKGERWVAKGYKIPIFEFYKKIRDNIGVTMEKDLVDFVNRDNVLTVESLTTDKRFGKVLPIQLMRYLVKQKKDTYYLRDYWAMCIKIYNKIPAELKWPKDLQFAHDEVTKQIKWQDEQKLISGFIAAEEKYAPYAWSDESLGLCIRVCQNQKEMIAEGKALHHCVARYAESHSKGDTCIMLIRRIAEPNVPFFTLELKNGKVVQNRGNHNCERTPEVKAFEQRWLNYIKNLEKEGRSNGKRSRNKKEQRAGA